MPAITVDNPLLLPRLAVPDPGSVLQRTVASVTTAPAGYEGEGFPVRRAFAGVEPGLLDPFLHLDEMGAVEYAPGEPKGTAWHPHRGFETVTYMIDGQMAGHPLGDPATRTVQEGRVPHRAAGPGAARADRHPQRR